MRGVKARSGLEPLATAVVVGWDEVHNLSTSIKCPVRQYERVFLASSLHIHKEQSQYCKDCSQKTERQGQTVVDMHVDTLWFASVLALGVCSEGGEDNLALVW